MQRGNKVSRRTARLSSDRRRYTESDSQVLNVVSLVDLSSGSIEKKLDDFLSKVKDENVRENCFRKLDVHVNGLLDAVRMREKKRKNAKTESNGLDKIDLTTPDSILTQINLKSVFNVDTFGSLPLYYQYKLIKLLPRCDQELTPQGWLNLSATALNNEYFTKAHRHWAKQLKESKLNSDFVQKCKADLEKGKQSLDPFKVKHFEPIWNEPLNSRTHLDQIIERERLSRLSQTSTKERESRNLCELNLKLKRGQELGARNAAGNTRGDQSAEKSKPLTTPKRRTSRPSARRTRDSSFQTPIKSGRVTPISFGSNSAETSPLSVGSITVKKSVSSPIQNWAGMSSGLDQSSPTNGKLFYISSNGKLLQIQPTVQQSPQQTVESSGGQPTAANLRKRKIDLDDNISLNGISLDYNQSHAYTTPVLSSPAKPTQLLSNFLTVPEECERRALVNCVRCKAFCHPDCVHNSLLCRNCL